MIVLASRKYNRQLLSQLLSYCDYNKDKNKHRQSFNVNQMINLGSIKCDLGRTVLIRHDAAFLINTYM